MPRSRIVKRVIASVSTVACVLFLFAGLGATVLTDRTPPQLPGGVTMFALVAVAAWFTWFGLVIPVRGSDEAVAITRLRRRADARNLLARNPALAAELHVGRPDLHGTYDDGGLIDVNEVPAEVLAQAPGLNDDIAKRIIEARKQVGRFDSTDDLEALLNLGARDLDGCRELLVYSDPISTNQRRHALPS
jgi:hypothetical protein